MVRGIKALMSGCLRVVVMIVLYVAVRLTWSVRVHGLRHIRRRSITYFAITHKRDFDSMSPVPRILLQKGGRALLGDLRFAMRSDSFTRGFLARVVRRPAWFVRLLRPISLSSIVRALGVMPLQDLRLRPLEEWIRECLPGNSQTAAAQVLAPHVIAELAHQARLEPEDVAGLPLSRLLRWKFHAALIRFMGPEALLGGQRRVAERAVAERARHFLAEISAWMRHGGSIYSAPEGRLSPDGRLSRLTAGFYRVIRDAPPDTSVVPIVIMYDFMSTGRARMFVDVAPAIEHAPALARDELSERLRQSWMRAARYTCTQLASGYLVKSLIAGQLMFTQTDLADAVMRQACDLRATGRSVDVRLLTPRGAGARVRRYLAFAERAGAVRRNGHGNWKVQPVSVAIEVPHGEVGYRTSPVAYAWNELQDMGIPTAIGSATPDELTG